MLGNKKFVKSLKWPGFINYFSIGSGDFGFLYFGNGIENKDLEFLLNN